MSRMRLSAAVLATIGSLSLAGSALAADAAAGEKFAKVQCGICHTFDAGKNKIGPSLFGVVGRKAGTAEGFSYSEANKSSGLTWDTATLDKYLTKPSAVVPGTKMAYAGIKDDGKRADVIAFLETLK